MKLNYFKNIFVLICIVLMAACTQISPPEQEVEHQSSPTIVTTPTKRPPSYRILPPPSKPEFTLDVEAGRIDNPGDGNFIQLYERYDSFAVQSMNKNSPFWDMYKSHIWGENGVEITSLNGDVITITKSELTDQYLKFSILKNGKVSATIYTQDGVLIMLQTLPYEAEPGHEQRNARLWCIYNPRGNKCVDCFEKSNTSGTCYRPTPKIVLNFDTNWNIEIDRVNKVRVGNMYQPVYCNFYKDGESDLTKYTYKLPDGTFYRFAGKPYVCPEFLVVYP